MYVHFIPLLVPGAAAGYDLNWSRPQLLRLPALRLPGTRISFEAGLIDRRNLLRAAGMVLPSLYLPAIPAQTVETTPGGLIVRRKDPDNFETPPPFLNTFITPNDRFYVRNHFAAPQLDAGAWRLRIEGAVDHPFEIGYDELRKMPSRSETTMLECAGNNRASLEPKEKGVQWVLGAVGNARWTGVPLAAILDRAGLKAGAVEVVLEGSDRGAISEDPATPGEIHFTRSLPVAKARQPEVILAYQMNGEPLPGPHGFPVRAIVPGWYGMASVKWLSRIVAVNRPYGGYFQSLTYTRWDRSNGLASLIPITEMQVKSQIFKPADREPIPSNARYSVKGAAWTGDADIAKVEVSADGGGTWAPARLLDQAAAQPARYAWRLWEFDWRTPASGGYRLMSRATDSRGRVQPPARNRDWRSYAITHSLPVQGDIR